MLLLCVPHQLLIVLSVLITTSTIIVSSPSEWSTEGHVNTPLSGSGSDQSAETLVADNYAEPSRRVVETPEPPPPTESGELPSDSDQDRRHPFLAGRSDNSVPIAQPLSASDEPLSGRNQDRRHPFHAGHSDNSVPIAQPLSASGAPLSGRNQDRRRPYLPKGAGFEMPRHEAASSGATPQGASASAGPLHEPKARCFYCGHPVDFDQIAPHQVENRAPVPSASVGRHHVRRSPFRAGGRGGEITDADFEMPPPQAASAGTAPQYASASAGPPRELIRYCWCSHRHGPRCCSLDEETDRLRYCVSGEFVDAADSRAPRQDENRATVPSASGEPLSGYDGDWRYPYHTGGGGDEAARAGYEFPLDQSGAGGATSGHMVPPAGASQNPAGAGRGPLDECFYTDEYGHKQPGHWHPHWVEAADQHHDQTRATALSASAGPLSGRDGGALEMLPLQAAAVDAPTLAVDPQAADDGQRGGMCSRFCEHVGRAVRHGLGLHHPRDDDTERGNPPVAPPRALYSETTV